MRWPWVRRKWLDHERARRRVAEAITDAATEELLFRAERAYEDRDKAMKGCKAANDRADEAMRAAGKLISDLRVVQFHVERTLRPGDEAIVAYMRIPSRMLWESFRFDGTFRTALAYEVEHLILTDPELRNHVWGGPTAPTP